MMKKYIFIIIIQLSSVFGLISENKTDSLMKIWNNHSLHDTLRLNAIDRICWGGLLFSDADSALALAKMQYEFAQKTKNKKHEAFSFNTQSTAYNLKGDYNKAIDLQIKSIKAWEELGNKAKQGAGWYNLAKTYRTIGLLQKAIDCINTSLKLSEESNYLKGLGNCYILLGLINQDTGDLEKAKAYMLKSIDVYEKIDNTSGLGFSYHNMGTLAHRMKNYDEALMYYQKSQEIKDKLGLYYEKSATYNNIGLVYKEIGKYDLAIESYMKAKVIVDSVKDKSGAVFTLINMGNLFIAKGDIKNAMKCGLEANKSGKETGTLSDIESSAKLLWNTYSSSGDYKMALFYHEEYIKMRDSVNNRSNAKALAEQEYKFEYEKKSLTDSLDFILEKELSEKDHQVQLTKEANQRYMLYVGIGFSLILVGISFIGYQRKRKDNVIIREQKQLVELQKLDVEKKNLIIEEKQKEILDSITYAKRLQEAILPSKSLIDNYIAGNFILYKPKDIVAGDFYWFEHLDNCSYIAAADSTGHGVPGAMVSVVCSNALNRAVHEFGLRTPGEILDKTRELVLATFAKSDKDVKDGMDISLAKISEIKAEKTIPGRLVIPKGQTLSDVLNSQTKFKVEWAGANNPLWYLSNGIINEVTAHKQPIGKTDHPTPFPTHTLELNKGDVLYLFTDGYADQFGGPKGKKFKYKNLSELLLQNADRLLEDQKHTLHKTFEDWKGKLEQIDDVCVIGIKI